MSRYTHRLVELHHITSHTSSHSLIHPNHAPTLTPTLPPLTAPAAYLELAPLSGLLNVYFANALANAFFALTF